MATHKLENYLRTYRKRSGLTQREVAFLVGCRNGAQVSRYEKRRRLPPLRTALACEAAFGVPGGRSSRRRGRERASDPQEGQSRPNAKGSGTGSAQGQPARNPDSRVQAARRREPFRRRRTRDEAQDRDSLAERFAELQS